MQTNRHYIALISIVLLGLALRLYQIDAVAFRGDEAYTAQNWVQRPIAETLTSTTITQDPQAPLSYLLFWGWAQIVGVSEFTLRTLPALLNILGIVALYGLGKRFVNPTVGVVAALMWAIHPFEIWHAQDARNYAIWASLSATGFLLFLRALAKPSGYRWLMYGVVALVTAYIYYLEVFILAALSVYAFVTLRHNKNHLMRWFIVQVSIGIALLPWYIYLYLQLQQGLGYGGTTGGFDAFRLVTWFVPTLYFGSTLPMMGLVGIVTSILLVICLILLFRDQTQYMNLLLLIIIIPTIGIAIVSTQLNVFTPRYILAIVPALLLIPLMTYKTYRYVFFVVIGAWMIVANVANYQYFYVAPPKAPEWRGLVSYLEVNTQPDEIVIQVGVDASFGYYYRSAEVPAGEFALPADVTQPIPDVIATIEETADTFHTLWIVGQTFPDWPNAGVVEDWAFSNLQLMRETRIDGLPVRQFMQWDVMPNEIEADPITTFDNTIELVGINILPVLPTNELIVWVYWHPIQQTEAPLTAFMHLVGDVNPTTGSSLWAQDDHLPQNGRVTTDLWQTNQVYRDVFVLPLGDVRDGDYHLHLGFYDPETSQRATIPSGEDAYVTDTITINRGE